MKIKVDDQRSLKTNLVVGKTYLDGEGTKVTITDFYKGDTFPYEGDNHRFYKSNGMYLQYKSECDLVKEVGEKEKVAMTKFTVGQLVCNTDDKTVLLVTKEVVGSSKFSGVVVVATPGGDPVGFHYDKWTTYLWEPYEGELTIKTPPFKFGDKVICMGETHGMYGVIVSDKLPKDYYRVMFKGSTSTVVKAHDQLEPDNG